ncbi:MAG: superoxide dismutase family protein [Bacteroidota bacterium]
MRVPTLVLIALVLAACTTPDAEPAASDEPAPAADAEPLAQLASVEIAPLAGSGVSGTITFSEGDEGVTVAYQLSGLTPGLHGFHVHANGDCGPGEDGTPGGAAGGHFNPEGHEHGAPSNEADARHKGDLGNIEADANGLAEGAFADTVLRLDGETSIVGKAFIVHAGEDDLSSQPSGAAGARVGCGIIAMDVAAL